MLAGLRAAEQAAGRPAGSARLVAVTKGHALADIERAVLAHGAFPLAENKGQELRDKAALWPEREWHFIGPLQRNKIKYLRPVTLVHALEALWQAEELARQGQAWGRVPDVLIQVHNGEAQKHGAAPPEVAALYHQVTEVGVRVRGLMVMAPQDDPAGASRVFAQTAALAGELGLPELSMGMSDDFPLAIAHGATLIRVGRALFT